MGVIQSKYIFSPECDKCIQTSCGQCLKKDDVAKKKQEEKQKQKQNSKSNSKSKSKSNSKPLISGGRRKLKKSKKRSKKYLK